MNLDTIRQHIDEIDQDLVDLLKKRMDLVTQVADYKKAHDLAILDKEREDKVHEQIAQFVQEDPYQEPILAIFHDILTHSRSYQLKRIREKDDR